MLSMLMILKTNSDTPMIYWLVASTNRYRLEFSASSFGPVNYKSSLALF